MRSFFYITKTERELVLRVAAVLAIPLCFVVLIPTVIGIVLVEREAKTRSKENRALIVRMDTRVDVERAALVLFVCTSLNIQDQAQTRTAPEYMRRFGEILADLGARCP